MLFLSKIASCKQRSLTPALLDFLLLRPALTLAVEVYTPEREREFDDAEAELAAVLARRPRVRSPRTKKR
jgi:hypothetical protein